LLDPHLGRIAVAAGAAGAAMLLAATAVGGLEEPAGRLGALAVLAGVGTLGVIVYAVVGRGLRLPDPRSYLAVSDDP
jgi:hypothetical protein